MTSAVRWKEGGVDVLPESCGHAERVSISYPSLGHGRDTVPDSLGSLSFFLCLSASNFQSIALKGG